MLPDRTVFACLAPLSTRQSNNVTYETGFGIAIPIHNLESEGSSPNLQEAREIKCQPHRQYVITFQQNLWTLKA